jgi:hypothetical protein
MPAARGKPTRLQEPEWPIGWSNVIYETSLCPSDDSRHLARDALAEIPGATTRQATESRHQRRRMQRPTEVAHTESA